MRALALGLALGLPAAAFGGASAWLPPFDGVSAGTLTALRGLSGEIGRVTPTGQPKAYDAPSALQLRLLGALEAALPDDFESRARSALQAPSAHLAELAALQRDVEAAYAASSPLVEKALQDRIAQLAADFAAGRIDGNDLLQAAHDLDGARFYSNGAHKKVRALMEMAFALHFAKTLTRARQLAEGMIATNPSLAEEERAILRLLFHPPESAQRAKSKLKGWTLQPSKPGEKPVRPPVSDGWHASEMFVLANMRQGAERDLANRIEQGKKTAAASKNPVPSHQYPLRRLSEMIGYAEKIGRQDLAAVYRALLDTGLKDNYSAYQAVREGKVDKKIVEALLLAGTEGKSPSMFDSLLVPAIRTASPASLSLLLALAPKTIYDLVFKSYLYSYFLQPDRPRPPLRYQWAEN